MKRMGSCGTVFVLISFCGLFPVQAQVQPTGASGVSQNPAPPKANRVYWGDTHLHTGFSMDAGAAGCRLSPADAYRFAKGIQVKASSGQEAKLARPLDFLVVSDHSDNMGFFPKLLAGDPAMLADPTGKRWYDMIQSGKGMEAAVEIIQRFSQGTFPKALESLPGTPAFRSAWTETIKAAEEANDPGRFTAFIGYEWTSTTGGNNLHRNVIFRDDGSKAAKVEPYTTLKPLGSDNPRDLWKWMAEYEKKTKGNVLAIPHNGNVSNGRMFPLIESFSGKPIDRAYAEERAQWERIYEATQIKGDGETHPFLSPNDEFANFERWDKGNLELSQSKKPEMLEFEYARSALKNGLKIEQQIGVNPYKFGMIGSTDAHTGLTTADSDNFFGKTTASEPSAHRLSAVFLKTPQGTIMDWEQTASGYAGVWAHENTREALFDAMERREVYATTGPRMTVRFFGGWDYEPQDAKNADIASIGYAKGVPMGGDLSKGVIGKAPVFLISALKDPVGANLDRVQVIKGWLDKNGQVAEKIYDVAWSGGRKVGADGKVPPVGNTVDAAKASYSNSIGGPSLTTVWKDPDYDPSLRAFYYLRVLEIPTPRWTTYDAKRFGVKMDPKVPVSVQQRAYTSPIWYNPTI